MLVKWPRKVTIRGRKVKLLGKLVSLGAFLLVLTSSLLHGIPILIDDLYATHDMETTGEQLDHLSVIL